MCLTQNISIKLSRLITVLSNTFLYSFIGENCFTKQLSKLLYGESTSIVEAIHRNSFAYCDWSIANVTIFSFLKCHVSNLRRKLCKKINLFNLFFNLFNYFINYIMKVVNISILWLLFECIWTLLYQY